MQFTIILGFTAATIIQLVTADAHSSCHCAVNGTMNAIYTKSACSAYPKNKYLDGDTAARSANLSAVSVQMSNTTLSCIAFDTSTKAEVPVLASDEFNTLCLSTAPTGADVASECDPFGQDPMSLNGTQSSFGDQPVRRRSQGRNRRYGGN